MKSVIQITSLNAQDQRLWYNTVYAHISLKLGRSSWSDNVPDSSPANR